jgi:hypothetical protein
MGILLAVPIAATGRLQRSAHERIDYVDR